MDATHNFLLGLSHRDCLPHVYHVLCIGSSILDSLLQTFHCFFVTVLLEALFIHLPQPSTLYNICLCTYTPTTNCELGSFAISPHDGLHT